MLQRPEPEDYVIATGETRSLQEFVEVAFRQVGLDAQAHVVLDKALYRPTDIASNAADPSKAESTLGWRASVRMEETVQRMVAAELSKESLSVGP
jgi:GDPmannose 4,6-dehydratase